ncbi:hypothetical protein M513_09260 [Trichuris suis]|uniref:DDE-1 domain-containing protein n=1 Tax=Trichuris suis TaxID=68888 RepID=A0A085LXU7_9BILA|nr:hypothetical protein M513_09260 [Trichuris suis]
MIYCLANAWNSAEESTLTNGWHKLWPGLRGERTDQEDINDATGVTVFEKKRIQELLEFAQNLTNPSATDLASRVAEDNLEEWMEAIMLWLWRSLRKRVFGNCSSSHRT